MDKDLIKTQGWKAYPYHVTVGTFSVNDVIKWLDSKHNRKDNMWKTYAYNTFGFKLEKDAIWVALIWGENK